MIEFWIPGIPVPKGSAKAFYRKGMRFPVVVQDNEAKQKPWASMIAVIASGKIEKPFDGPVWLRCTFNMPRPKGHIGKRGLKPSAPYYHLVKPDLDKLVRCVKDALTSIAWIDDSQVVQVDAKKGYAFGEHVGAAIAIETKAEAFQ